MDREPGQGWHYFACGEKREQLLALRAGRLLISGVQINGSRVAGKAAARAAIGGDCVAGTGVAGWFVMERCGGGHLEGGIECCEG